MADFTHSVRLLKLPIEFIKANIRPNVRIIGSGCIFNYWCCLRRIPSAISVVALTLVQRSAHVIATLLLVVAEKPQNFTARPEKNNMTIMSQCCIDAESYTAESRCILESIIFPTSSEHLFVLICLRLTVSPKILFVSVSCPPLIRFPTFLIWIQHPVKKIMLIEIHSHPASLQNSSAVNSPT